jgi:dTDP-4-dehydrorhamnose 3,5-epimerase-like enzyme
MGQEHQTKVIEIPTFTDTRGTLTVVEWAKHLPFLPQRFYCISGAAPGVRRGGHAHWVESEAIFALSGGVTVWTDDGRTLTEYRLERPHLLLLIPPGVWHELHGFSANTLCAVFASHQYNTEDYCRDYNEFLRRAGGRPAENPVS